MGGSLAIGLLVLSTIGLRVAETTGVEPEESKRITAAIQRAIEDRTRQTVKNVSGCQGTCDVDEVIEVRILGGLTRTRVLAERIAPGRRRSIEIEASASGWGEAADRGSTQLYPELPSTPRTGDAPTPQPITEAPPAVIPESSSSHVWTWSLLGIGAASGGAAIAFAVDSINAERDLDRFNIPDPAFDQTAARATRSRSIAFTLLGVAVAASAGALLVELAGI